MRHRDMRQRDICGRARERWWLGSRRSMAAAGVSVTMAAVMTVASAAPLQAQTVVGRVLDDARNAPVAGARIRLLDTDGDARGEAASDNAGTFTLTPPEAGDYYLELTRIGYRRVLTPLLSFSDAVEPVRLEIMMSPAPVGLEGLSVEVDPVAKAEADLRTQGIDPANLGNSWITQAEIDAIEVKRDVGSILEWSAINGLRVIRPENMTAGEAGSRPTPGSGQKQSDFGMCISLVRGRTWQGAGRCALVVLDGLPSNNEHLLDLDPLTVAAMAVLQPIDARILYGTRADAGAVLVWTKR